MFINVLKFNNVNLCNHWKIMYIFRFFWALEQQHKALVELDCHFDNKVPRPIINHTFLLH